MWAARRIRLFRKTLRWLGIQSLRVGCVWGAASFGAGSACWAQSAADLRGRIVVDGQLADWETVECVFRNATICSALAIPGPCPDEEPAGDSAWSRLQDVLQIKVTWDATHLYLATQAVIADHALLLLLDTNSGGLQDLTDLAIWRRAIRFGDAFQPDFLLAVHDRQRSPDLWRARSPQGLEPIAPDEFLATASFQAEAAGRALEAAIPWSLLFPGAPQRVNPDSLAPAEPMFVLPPSSAEQGLRLQAVVVHAEAGFSAADVAPDASHPLPLAPRDPVVLDRAVHVEWTTATSPPHFVDFGAAVQLQTVDRFAPTASLQVSSPILLSRLDTYAFQGLGTAATSRLLLADAGHDLQFVFDCTDPTLEQLYVTASIYSMRGERIAVLYEDSLRRSSVNTAPWGRFSDPNLDRWDGEASDGAPADAGMYLLRVTVGANPGVASSREQRTIVVVR